MIWSQGQKVLKGFNAMVACFVVVCLSLCAVIFVILSSVMKDKPSVSSENCGGQLVIMDCVSSYC